MDVRYDFNSNGKVDVIDLFRIIDLLYAALLPEEYPFTERELKSVDENGDGQIDSDEVLSAAKKISQHLEGYIIQDEIFQ